MEQHVKIVAILNIVMGGLGVLVALFLLLLFGGLAGAAGLESDPGGPVVLGMVGALTFGIVLVLSAPSLIGGIGLLKFRPWAQTLTIVTSILNLINIPLGTALGVYGLWVLFNKDTKPLFKAG